VARRAAARLQFVHPTTLNLGRLLARLLDLQPHRVTALQAEQVGEPSQLVRAAVNLDRLPAEGFGYPNNRGDD